MNHNVDIKTRLTQFKELWNESLSGNYSNSDALGNLARQIRDAKCNDEFLISSLTKEEETLYRYATTLANVR